MKAILAALIGLMLLGAGHLQAADDPIYPPYKSGRLNFGLNYGYPFSQTAGIRVEATPKGIFGYQLALGIALLRRDLHDDAGALHLGWSIGATAYALGHQAKFTPYLSFMVGLVARAMSREAGLYAWEERLVPGGSLSFGIRYRGAYCGYFFRRIFNLPKGFELVDMPLGGLYFGWSFSL